MTNLFKPTSQNLDSAGQASSQPPFNSDPLKKPNPFSLKKIRGSVLFVVGYLLSPLCWWNDLIFNLPVAYAFGYICRWISVSWFVPGLIAGYWLSNLVGILLMQFGAIDVFQQESNPHNLKKDLIMGVLSSTIYTLVILALVQLHIFDPSAWLSEGLPDLASLWPMTLHPLPIGLK
jgi:hypothetical protein